MNNLLQSLAAILWLTIFLVYAATVALPLEIASRLVSKYQKRIIVMKKGKADA